MSKCQPKFEYNKRKKGDRIPLWTTVKEVCRNCPYPASNEVTVVAECCHNPSAISVELAVCDVEQVVHREDVLTKVRSFIAGKLSLSKKGQEVVKSLG